MPIKRLTPISSTRDYLEEQIERRINSILRKLAFVGESALTQARTMHKYQDQSGNLTSSIGYCILNNGRVVIESSFEVVSGGQEGAEKGRQFLNQLKAQNSEGIVFLMVAGMNYAQYVEAMGLDVLDSAEMLAERMVPQILKSLK